MSGVSRIMKFETDGICNHRALEMDGSETDQRSIKNLEINVGIRMRFPQGRERCHGHVTYGRRRIGRPVGARWSATYGVRLSSPFRLMVTPMQRRIFTAVMHDENAQT